MLTSRLQLQDWLSTFCLRFIYPSVTWQKTQRTVRSSEQEVIKHTLENRKGLLIFINYFRFTTHASKKCVSHFRYDKQSRKQNRKYTIFIFTQNTKSSWLCVNMFCQRINRCQPYWTIFPECETCYLQNLINSITKTKVHLHVFPQLTFHLFGKTPGFDQDAFSWTLRFERLALRVHKEESEYFCLLHWKGRMPARSDPAY